MKQIFYFLALILSIACTSQDKGIEDKPIKEERKKLYDLIMEYRKQNKLPVIPISKSLNIVAQTHVLDLQNNQPVKGKCNLHSWSNKGKWTPVCYTSDHKQAKGMWNKPKELTSYTGNGFEISYYFSGKASAENSLNGWKKSTGHNNVILNKSIWKNSTWNAIGVGIYKNYAVVWFGEEKDTN